jgi:hypothetical protein
MSFLDQTGLGTFWAKLKNYFVHKEDTEEPVTGLTDILTPINILPNGNFSKSDTSIASSGLNGNLNINGWAAIGQRATWTDNGSELVPNGIRFKGTLTADSTSNAHYLFFRTNETFRINNGVTIACRYVNNNNDGRIVATSLCSGNSGNLLHIYNGTNNFTSSTESVRIFQTVPNSTSDYTFGFTIGSADHPLEANESVNVDITVTDVRLYNGEFKNPPLTNNLDLDAAFPYAFKDMRNSIFINGKNVGYQSNSGSAYPAGTYRLLKLGKPNSGLIYLDFILLKQYNSIIHCIYHIKVAFAFNGDVTYTMLKNNIGTSDINTIKYTLSCNFYRQSNNTTNRLTAVKITGDDTTGELYLSIQTSYPLGGYLKVFPYGPVLNNNNHIYDSAWTGTRNTTDTVFATANAVEGL